MMIRGRRPDDPDGRDARDRDPLTVAHHGHRGRRRPRPGKGVVALALAALGVVFGDIGTSPLYALRTVFTIDGGIVKATQEDVYGVISIMFWSVTVVVSIKYVLVLMRADNNGEGGVMALAALARRLYAERRGGATIFLVIGIIGVSLFYGDSVITPAVSVLSAVEGLSTAAPSVEHLIVPIAAVILVLLFFVQRFGTGKVGNLFGPVMLLWFVVIAVAGVPHIIAHPGVLQGLSPTWAIAFLVAHPYITFVAMGAVVLVITGAEALYADMGHFGRPAILRAWFFVVFPALVLNYLGQASLVLEDPSAAEGPVLPAVPRRSAAPRRGARHRGHGDREPGGDQRAFSLTRQAVQLGLLPPLTIRQTSREEGGQIYLPAVNLLLFIGGVMAIMLAFRSSASLATAYGVSVTGALVVDTLLLLLVVKPLWQWKTWKLVLAAVVFGGLELTFLAGNLSKILHGGVGPAPHRLAVITLMTTWRRGRQLVQEERKEREGSLAEFIERVNTKHIPRVEGIAIFPHPNKETTPLALRANVEHNHVMHRTVLIVSVLTANVPHVPHAKAFFRDDLGYEDDGIDHITVKFGFSTTRTCPVPCTPRAWPRCWTSTGRDAARVVLHLPRRTPAAAGQPGHGALAEEAVRGARAQRRRPRRTVRTAGAAHRDDGQRRRDLTAAVGCVPRCCSLLRCWAPSRRTA